MGKINRKYFWLIYSLFFFFFKRERERERYIIVRIQIAHRYGGKSGEAGLGEFRDHSSSRGLGGRD